MEHNNTAVAGIDGYFLPKVFTVNRRREPCDCPVCTVPASPIYSMWTKHMQKQTFAHFHAYNEPDRDAVRYNFYLFEI